MKPLINFLPVYRALALGLIFHGPRTLSAAPPDDVRAAGGAGDPVIVTGSNIPRTDVEGPQTVRILDKKAIDRSGARTVAELIQKLPENAGGFSESDSPGRTFAPGAAAASLRGLGITATLVLLNGRRVAPFPLAQSGTDAFADLNSIPLSAIDRVEILKESASAIYGSDAIAGVINIVLKENYSGGEIESSYGNTTKADASEVRESFASGINQEKFRLFITGNYLHRESLAARDRDYSSSANVERFSGLDFRSDYANPGSVFLLGTGEHLAIPRGSNGKLTAGDFKTGRLASGEVRNLVNGNKVRELIPETERWGGLLTFGYNLMPHLEVFGEALYQSVQTKSVVEASPVDSDNGVLRVPKENPFNPFGQDLGFRWLSLEAGPRKNTTDLDASRFIAGLRFKDLPNNWSGEGSVLYSESEVVDRLHSGYLSVNKTLAALEDTDPDTALNVFGDGFGINNPKTLLALAVSPRRTGEAYIWDYDLRATGDLFSLPAGPVRLAIGGSYREESFKESFSEAPDSVVGFGVIGSAGNRDVRSALWELSLPITSAKWNLPMVRAFELSIAERYDDYSDFGSAAKPKFWFQMEAD